MGFEQFPQKEDQENVEKKFRLGEEVKFFSKSENKVMSWIIIGIQNNDVTIGRDSGNRKFSHKTVSLQELLQANPEGSRSTEKVESFLSVGDTVNFPSASAGGVIEWKIRNIEGDQVKLIRPDAGNPTITKQKIVSLKELETYNQSDRASEKAA